MSADYFKHDISRDLQVTTTGNEIQICQMPQNGEDDVILHPISIEAAEALAGTLLTAAVWIRGSKRKRLLKRRDDALKTLESVKSELGAIEKELAQQ